MQLAISGTSTVTSKLKILMKPYWIRHYARKKDVNESL